MYASERIEFKIDDEHKSAKFFHDFLRRLSIHYLKVLVKAWVKFLRKKEKQRNYKQIEHKPVWWPDEVEFCPPNSLVKSGTLFAIELEKKITKKKLRADCCSGLICLAIGMLRHRHHDSEKNIKSISQIAENLLLESNIWSFNPLVRSYDEKVIREVLRVAEIYESYDAGEIGLSLI